MVSCLKSKSVSIDMTIYAYFLDKQRRNFSTVLSSMTSVSPLCAICSTRLVTGLKGEAFPLLVESLQGCPTDTITADAFHGDRLPR